MAGGVPIPVPVTVPEEKILCIADLERAGSRKMEKGARGELNGGSSVLFRFPTFPVMPFNILLLYASLNLDHLLRFLSVILVSTYERIQSLP